jgi:cell division septation protein DedD
MAKRGKSQARRQGANGTPVWAWLLIGLFVGALFYFGFQQYQAISAPQNGALPLPGAKLKDGATGKSTEPPASALDDDGVLDTDYSFYDVLPTQETVEVPEAQDDAMAADPAAKKSTAAVPADKTQEPAAAQAAPDKSPPADTSRYLLQAGSFERSADADDLKARIALSGEPARVEQAEVNGKTMYRVRLGPYENAQAANTAKANLAGQGLDAVSIKIK